MGSDKLSAIAFRMHPASEKNIYFRDRPEITTYNNNDRFEEIDLLGCFNEL
jgi:hypothetical protein